MTKDLAVLRAKEYAQEWGVPFGTVTKFKTHREWIVVVKGHTVYFESPVGLGNATIGKIEGLIHFRFYPTDSRYVMIPPWAAFPGCNGLSIDWRMGNGEEYWDRWCEWFSQLTGNRQAEYKKRFPPPGGIESGWELFYELRAK